MVSVNILYIAESKIPSRTADSVHVMKMCSALACVLAGTHAKALAFSDENAHVLPYTTDHRVTLAVPETGETDEYTGNVYEYYGVPDAFNIRKIKLPLPRLNILNGLRYSYQAAKLLSRNEYDIIFGRDFYTCFFLACLHRKKIYLEYHTHIIPGSLADTAFNYLIKQKQFGKLVVITEALKKHFITQFGMDEKQILVAPDGADIPSGDVKPAVLTEKSAGKFQVGYIGQLYQGRGIELLEKLAPACPYAFFHIIGGNEKDIGYWKNKYQDIDNIRFYGFIAPAQTLSYGRSMDVLIAPYQHNAATEGYSSPEKSTVNWMSPMKIFEYMAMGKPIVSSNMPVLKEVLTDGVNSILCTADNAREWCEAIDRLHGDKELSKKLAEGAFSSLHKYTWKTRAENILKFVCNAETGSGTESPNTSDELQYTEKNAIPAANKDSRPSPSVFDKLYICRLLKVAVLFLRSYLSRVTVLSSTR